MIVGRRKKMDVKILWLAALLCLFQSAHGRSLDDVKNTFLNNIRQASVLVNREFMTAIDLSFTYFGRTYGVYSHKLELGEMIFNTTKNELNFTLESFNKTAQFRSCPEEVFHCMNTEVFWASKEAEKGHLEEFKKAMDLVRVNGEMRFLRVFDHWRRRIYNERHKLFSSSISRIKEATSIQEVTKAYESFGLGLAAVREMMVKMTPETSKEPLINWERNMQMEVDNWRKESRYILKTAIENIKACLCDLPTAPISL